MVYKNAHLNTWIVKIPLLAIKTTAWSLVSSLIFPFYSLNYFSHQANQCQQIEKDAI